MVRLGSFGPGEPQPLAGADWFFRHTLPIAILLTGCEANERRMSHYGCLDLCTNDTRSNSVTWLLGPIICEDAAIIA
jgi:hypothetical protein